MSEPFVRWPSWVGVVAEDLEAQRKFYREVLGFREEEVGDGWVQFDLGGGRTFELLAMDPSVPQYEQRRYQVGFTVDDIRAARDRLIEEGVEVVSDIEGGEGAGSLWAYFRDPEGNVFEITQRLR